MVFYVKQNLRKTFLRKTLHVKMFYVQKQFYVKTYYVKKALRKFVFTSKMHSVLSSRYRSTMTLQLKLRLS